MFEQDRIVVRFDKRSHNLILREAALDESNQKMKRITLFSWGYWGWGNSVKKFVEATDAIESARGYGSPIFADIRIRRSVRAKGFNGNAFEKIVRAERYVWLKDLGNQAVADGAGGIEIANPKAAADLLDLAIKSAEDRRRVIFFCACQIPARCHRSKVARLVLREAKKRGLNLEIIEWPGGDPLEMNVEAPKTAIAALSRGLKYIPIGNRVDLARLGSVPWGSTVNLQNGSQSEPFVTGPACFQVSQWYLPVLNLDDEVDRWRKVNGYVARSSV